MKALAVFDWNGTLIDDTEAIIEADNYALKHFGKEPIDTDVFKDTVSIPKEKFYILHGCSAAFLKENITAFVGLAAAHYQKELQKCRLRSGALETLRLLKENGVHIIILSNDLVDNIRIELRRFKIDAYIDTILANKDPLAFLKYAQKHDWLVQHLKNTGPYQPQIIIGDSTEEIFIGKKLGLITISLLNGIHSQRRLATESPDFLCSGLEEALAFLPEIFSKKKNTIFPRLQGQ